MPDDLVLEAPTAPTQAELKAQLRKACQQQRDALADEERQAYSKAFARHFLKHAKADSKVVAGYAAINNELDIMPLMAMLSNGDRICSLPVTSPPSRQLFFRRWHTGTKMVPGNYRIMMPSQESETVTPDIIILPMVGFDRHHQRIGYGAGYYDCTLRELRKKGYNPFTIGAAYSVQQVDRVPVEPHDEPLDMIITEKGILGKDF